MPLQVNLEIQKCPYCDSSLTEVESVRKTATVDGIEFAVHCRNCKAKGPATATSQLAIARWNFVFVNADAVERLLEILVEVKRNSLSLSRKGTRVDSNEIHSLLPDKWLGDVLKALGFTAEFDGFSYHKWIDDFDILVVNGEMAVGEFLDGVAGEAFHFLSTGERLSDG